MSSCGSQNSLSLEIPLPTGHALRWQFPPSVRQRQECLLGTDPTLGAAEPQGKHPQRHGSPAGPASVLLFVVSVQSRWKVSRRHGFQF